MPGYFEDQPADWILESEMQDIAHLAVAHEAEHVDHLSFVILEDDGETPAGYGCCACDWMELLPTPIPSSEAGEGER